MKCRTLFQLLCKPSQKNPGAWHCRFCGAAGEAAAIQVCPQCKAKVSQKSGRVPAGTELDLPEAWQIVRRGAAAPADEECQRAAGMNPQQLEAAQRAQGRARLGIHPDDFAAFDAGEMVGYDRQGQPIPGPNFSGDVEEEDELDEDDEPDPELE
jgi:hypothetical protein